MQKGEFAAEDFDEEVTVAAGGLEEAAVEPERLVAHQVKHGVHLPRIGEHLAMVSHPLAAFDLFRVLVVEHKKSVNFCLDRGSRQPIPKTRKPTDLSVSVSCLLVWDDEIVEISVHLKSKNALYYMFIFLFYSTVLLF